MLSTCSIQLSQACSREVVILLCVRPVAGFPMEDWRAGLSEGVYRLRSELCREQLPPYRTVDGDEQPWQSSPAGNDAGLQRFIVARKGNLQAAKKMFVEHLAWRRSVFPIPKAGLVARLLDEEVRFRRLRRDSDGCPVLLVNFLFGEFAPDDIPQTALVLASLRFFEDAIGSLDPCGAQQMSAIVFGCPPPVAWAHVMVKFFQNNYPERLKLAIIYPVPSTFVSLVRQVMWFVDENTRSKIDMETEEHPLLERFGFRSDDLPLEIRGGYHGVGERWKPDARKLLGMAYAFLLPHGRQVAHLEDSIYRAAKNAESPSSPSAGAGLQGEDTQETDWTSLLFACCMPKSARPGLKELPSDDFLDSNDGLDSPSPHLVKPGRGANGFVSSILHVSSYSLLVFCLLWMISQRQQFYDFLFVEP
ncbi:unnamed protein product [Effrenium voratum]|uniref:CRAL-TRIO domain-containing protein n=1 Tax=Effrenium voratum TaxID=2562239 RepID=A0AA36N9Y3_9DINO|nr:unnamed protein product [Effrenium voratum]CAJ1445467.1 unnamed protein product [Effrenium voratum]